MKENPDLKEWLVTNGLGGYASGTVNGEITRRFHGLLIAALPNPLGRLMMLNSLSERLRLPDHKIFYTGAEDLSGVTPDETLALAEFHRESGLPVWRYEVAGFVLEKRLLMPHGQNTVYVDYHLVKGSGALRLGLRPAIRFRAHEAPVNTELAKDYKFSIVEDRFEVSAGPELPVLRFLFPNHAATFTFDRKQTRDILYTIEKSRGYDSEGNLWSPGYFSVELEPGTRATLVASAESWEVLEALTPEAALEAELKRCRIMLSRAASDPGDYDAAELVLAADQFLVAPVGRVADAARAHAEGDAIRTVIAGYHWFGDWGRDTMISLEGLTLTTGRDLEARWILRTFASAVRDGLIPNLFPEGQAKGIYNTADATLWFFHAIQRYVEYSGDRTTLRMLLPKLRDIIEHHMKGTRFGIGVDHADGLLRQGEQGYQLTWMDAKVGDWVVTPRRGKAVEINALWYNALHLLGQWLRDEVSEAAAEPIQTAAARARASFNERFWYAEGGYLYDVVDGETGDDSACRPNQLIAISLKNPVLDQSRWQRVVEVATERLLTPVGLRSLAPGHPDYKPKYDGDLRSRDAAYHQGTVWAWLIGPYIDAWLKVNPSEPRAARRFLEGFIPHHNEACIGSISEVFDAEPPYTPRGCIAQAWSVAEVLRCWVKTAGQNLSTSRGSIPARR